MEAIETLKTLGYEVTIEGNNLRLVYKGTGEPPKDKILPLLDELRANKENAINYLKQKKMPYLDRHGTLIIPFDCDPRYHWWNNGQSIIETLKELGASKDIIKKYLH